MSASKETLDLLTMLVSSAPEHAQKYVSKFENVLTYQIESFKASKDTNEEKGGDHDMTSDSGLHASTRFGRVRDLSSELIDSTCSCLCAFFSNLSPVENPRIFQIACNWFLFILSLVKKSLFDFSDNLAKSLGIFLDRDVTIYQDNISLQQLVSTSITLALVQVQYAFHEEGCSLSTADSAFQLLDVGFRRLEYFLTPELKKKLSVVYGEVFDEVKSTMNFLNSIGLTSFISSGASFCATQSEYCNLVKSQLHAFLSSAQDDLVNEAEGMARLLSGLRGVPQWPLEPGLIDQLMNILIRTSKSHTASIFDVTRSLLIDALSDVEICFLEHLTTDPFNMTGDVGVSESMQVYEQRVMMNYGSSVKAFVETSENRIDVIHNVQRVLRWVAVLMKKSEFAISICLMSKVNYRQTALKPIGHVLTTIDISQMFTEFFRTLKTQEQSVRVLKSSLKGFKEFEAAFVHSVKSKAITSTRILNDDSKLLLELIKLNQ